MMRAIVTAAAVFLGLSAAPASAVTITLTVSGGPGVNGPVTRTCDSALCLTTKWSLASGEQYPATGTVSINTDPDNNVNTSDETMTITLAVATSVLDADLPLGQSASDDGASSLTFTGGSYVTLALNVTPSAGGAGTTVYTIDSGQTAALSFANVVASGAGPGGALSFGAVRVTGSCTVAPGNTALCGFIFGHLGATNFRIPGGAAFGTYDRWVTHAINVQMVPEPGTMLLFGVGLGGLALLRRRSPRL